MDSTHDLVDTLDSIDVSTFNGDEVSRIKAATAAKKLTQRLEAPWERMYETVIVQPLQVMAIKTATDIKLWSCLSSTPQTSAQLAQKTGTEQSLLRRILRVLVTAAFGVEERDVDTYVETELSKSLKQPEGMVCGLDILYRFGFKQSEFGPEYLKQNGYRLPEDMHQPPWKVVLGMPEYKGGFWEMLSEVGLQTSFDSFLSGMRAGMPSWAPLWPVKEKLLDGWDGKSVLLVDVGGGQGRDLANLAEMVHETHPNARLVLQDRPVVLEEAKSTGLHPQIEAMPHDFFKTNPVYGARAYFEHAVVHDWADKEARQILTQIKASMLPGYSKLLLMEMVMPESAKDADSRLACIDLQMGLNFCAMERTEKQWKALLESVGLRYLGHRLLFGKTSIIEAEL